VGRRGEGGWGGGAPGLLPPKKGGGGILGAMMSNVIRNLPCSQNEPLK
jgi:hypothetical protein